MSARYHPQIFWSQLLPFITFHIAHFRWYHTRFWWLKNEFGSSLATHSPLLIGCSVINSYENSWFNRLIGTCTSDARQSGPMDSIRHCHSEHGKYFIENFALHSCALCSRDEGIFIQFGNMGALRCQDVLRNTGKIFKLSMTDFQLNVDIANCRISHPNASPKSC